MTQVFAEANAFRDGSCSTELLLPVTYPSVK